MKTEITKIRESEIKKKTVIAVRETLRELPIGEPRFIHYSLIKPAKVRVATANLRKEGYVIEATEKGINDGITVINYGIK